MSKIFRAWKIDQPLFLPPSVQDFVAEDHLARFVVRLVRDDLGLAGITGTYGSERGQPPFDPAMMTALLLYSYCCGVYSSRRIAKACRERVDFMSIVALDAPDFRTISDFRRRHLKALGANRPDEEMPKGEAEKKRRAETIRKAKAELEAEAKAAAEAKLKAEAEAEARRAAEGRRKPGPKAAPPATEPEAKAQKNFTD